MLKAMYRIPDTEMMMTRQTNPRRSRKKYMGTKGLATPE